MWGGWNPFAQPGGFPPAMQMAQMAQMGYGMPPGMPQMMMMPQGMPPGMQPMPMPMPMQQAPPPMMTHANVFQPQMAQPVPMMPGGPGPAQMQQPSQRRQQLSGNKRRRRPPMMMGRGKRRKLRDPRLDIAEREAAKRKTLYNIASKDWKFEDVEEAPNITLLSPSADEVREAAVRFLQRSHVKEWISITDLHQRLRDSIGFNSLGDYGAYPDKDPVVRASSAKAFYVDLLDNIEVEEQTTTNGIQTLHIRYAGAEEAEEKLQIASDGIRKIPLVQVSTMNVGELKSALRERGHDMKAKKIVLIEALRELVKKEIEQERNAIAKKQAKKGRQVVDLTADEKGKAKNGKEDAVGKKRKAQAAASGQSAPKKAKAASGTRKKRKVQPWIRPYSPSASSGIYGCGSAYPFVNRHQLRCGAKVRVMFGKNRGKVARILGQRPDRKWDAVILDAQPEERKRMCFYDGSIRVVNEDAVSCELPWHPPLGNPPRSAWAKFPNEDRIITSTTKFLSNHLWARYPMFPGDVVMPLMQGEAIKFFRQHFFHFQAKTMGLYLYVRNAVVEYDTYKLECDVAVAEGPLWMQDKILGEVRDGQTARIMSGSVGNQADGAFMLTPIMGWCQFDAEDHTVLKKKTAAKDEWLDGEGFNRWMQLPALKRIRPLENDTQNGTAAAPMTKQPDAAEVAAAKEKADHKAAVLKEAPFPKILRKNIHEWSSANCATWVMSLKVNSWKASYHKKLEEEKKQEKKLEEEKESPKPAPADADATMTDSKAAEEPEEKKVDTVDLTVDKGLDYKTASEAFREQVDGSNILEINKKLLLTAEEFKFSEPIADSIWIALEALREYYEIWKTTEAGKNGVAVQVEDAEMGPVPNEEMCPANYKHALPVNVRWFHKGAVAKVFSGGKGFTKRPLYNSQHTILVLGESDFSFTQSFIRAFGDCRCQVVGSSYMLKRGHGQNAAIKMRVTGDLSRRFLNEGNGSLESNLNEITGNGGLVRFGVDAKDLQGSMMKPAREQRVPLPQKFDRIIFPFPRASLKKYDRKLDPELIRETLVSGSKELTPTGEIHIIVHFARNGINQFDLWCMRDTAEEEGFVWRAGLPIDWKDLEAYHPKDVTGKDWTPTCCYLLVFTPLKDANGKLWDYQPYKMDKNYLAKAGHDLGQMPSSGETLRMAEQKVRDGRMKKGEL